MIRERFFQDRRQRVGIAAMFAAVTMLLALQPGAAHGALVYNGTTNSAISFGATTYGGGAQITPKWIGNNVTGLNDVLASPGGTFQLANPVIGNNVASVGPAAYGPGAFQFLNWTGGIAPASGAPFGSGSAVIYGPSATFALTDATPGGGGSASYGIETWSSSYTQTTPYAGTFGTYLAIGGNIGLLHSDVVAALQTEVTVNGTLYTFAPLILAVSNQGGGVYSYVYNSASGAAIRVNSLTGAFSGLAIDSYAARFAAGSQINVTSTLTFYADPASISASTPDLSLLPSVPLPGESFGAAGVPEPSTALMGATALIAFAGFGWFRRRSRQAN